ncbi:MAG: DUF368 domain-containing protein [Planctomycetota bacterium]|nr:DUF368 domain-containing protein [Planctomycetota bacterium]
MSEELENSKEQENSRDRSLKDYAVITAKGFCMGAADIVPGVSGGTMAFILGIYQELINAVRSVDTQLIKSVLTFRFKEVSERFPWRFVGALLCGLLFAVLLLSHFLKHQLDVNPGKVLGFFFGLVLASIVTVARRGKPWNPGRMGLAAAAAAASYLLVGLVPVETPDALWFVFLCGVIAFCALILPGISGSFMLLLLGKYQFILGNVNDLISAIKAADASAIIHHALPLTVLALGGVIGVMSICRLLSWLLKEHYLPTLAVLTGLMIGSLRKVWPWKTNFFKSSEMNILPKELDGDFGKTVGLILAGLAIVLVIEWLARERKGEG